MTVVHSFDYFKDTNVSLTIPELVVDYEEELQNLWNRMYVLRK